MKKKIIITVIILFIISLIPFPTTMVPEWKLKVVDENDKPYQNLLVRQHCRNYTLNRDCSGDEPNPYTNQDGEVVFPKRTVSMSLLIRGMTTMGSLFQKFFSYHGELGSRVTVDASGPLGYQRLEYKPGEPLPDKFILRTVPQ